MPTTDGILTFMSKNCQEKRESALRQLDFDKAIFNINNIGQSHCKSKNIIIDNQSPEACYV